MLPAALSTPKLALVLGSEKWYNSEATEVDGESRTISAEVPFHLCSLAGVSRSGRACGILPM